MNNIEQYDELIERFLTGKMSNEEETSFKQELSSNPVLKEHAKAVSSLILGLKRKKQDEDYTIISDALKMRQFQMFETTGGNKGAEENIENSSAPKFSKNRKLVKLILWPLSVAAVFTIILNIFGNSSNKGEELFDKYYCEYSCEPQSRGNEDSLTTQQLTKMFNEIKDCKDCTEIITTLESIYNNIDNEYKYRAYANDIAWYLSLTYIKNNQLSDAKKILLKLIEENPDTEIAETCAKLLKELEKIE